jgi:polyhydroxybutyrate depolymerase
MTRRAAVALVAAAALATLSSAPAVAGRRTVTAGTTVVTLAVDGTPRDAVVYVPARVAAHPGRSVPLVLHLHGGLGSPELSIATTGLVEAADAHGFVVAFPRGTPVDLALPGDRTGYVWNAGHCCAVAARERVDDVAFLRALVEDLEDALPIDTDRVIMSGHSNGAMMTWRFACEAGGVLAAAMPVAGSLETADPTACTPQGTSLLAVHGDADRNHPIDGGPGSRSISGVAYRPFTESVATYARAARCGPRPRVTRAGVVTATRYRGCARGADVESVVLAGADHPWPGSSASGTAVQGEPFPDWSATEALVQLVQSSG